VQEPNIIRTRGDLTGKESQGKQNFVILMAKSASVLAKNCAKTKAALSGGFGFVG
jgi:hypothetical protein